MKTGIVLEGGAMRGVYTSGVLDYFIHIVGFLFINYNYFDVFFSF